MGTGSAGLGRLIGALHGGILASLKVFIRETHHYLKIRRHLEQTREMLPKILTLRLWINF
jgi:hypothetical protein